MKFRHDLRSELSKTKIYRFAPIRHCRLRAGTGERKQVSLKVQPDAAKDLNAAARNVTLACLRCADREARAALPGSAGSAKPRYSVSNNSTEAASRAKTADAAIFNSFAVSFRRRRHRLTIRCKCEARLNNSIIHVETKHAPDEPSSATDRIYCLRHDARSLPRCFVSLYL